MPVPRSAPRTQIPSTAATFSDVSGYWRHAPTLAIVMMAVFAIRLHEVVPLLFHLRPALVLSTLGVGVAIARSRREVIQAALRNRALRVVLLYFGWAAVTVPFALWSGQAFSTLLLVIPVSALVFAILLCAPTRENLARLCFGFAVAAGLLAIYLLAFGHALDGRMGGTFTLDSNDVACLFAMAFPFALAGAMRGKGAVVRIVSGVTAALLVVAIMQTASRGGVLALGAASLTFAFGLGGSRRFIVAAALVVCAALAWELGPPTFRERISTIGSQDYNYSAFGGRVQIWKRARMYYRQHPVAGVGLGNFEVAEGRYMKEIGMHGKWSAPHNAYLQSFAELGTVGGVIFLSLLAVMATSAFKLWRPSLRKDPSALHAPEFLASVAAYCLGAYFLSLAYFYVLFGLSGLVALARLTAERRETSARWIPQAQPVGPSVRPVGRTPSAVSSVGWRSAVGSAGRRAVAGRQGRRGGGR